MTGQYANIIVEISHEKVDRPFQYKIPQELMGRVEPGTMVVIPFGPGNKPINGYIMEVTDKAEYDIDKLKYILEIKNNGIDVEEKLIRLAWWMKREYGSTMITALKTVLPVKQQLKQLEKKKLTLAIGREEAEAFLKNCLQKKYAAQAKLVEQLLEVEELPQEIVTKKLQVSSAVISNLEKKGILKVITENVYRNPVHFKTEETVKKNLSLRQQEITDAILSDCRSNKTVTHLIHGITGSGKTEVYMEIIEQVIMDGKQAIVLIPEIALTYQTLLRFFRRFGDRVSVMNSKLSQGERYDQFEKAKNGKLDIMIGPRSALFTPFPNLGIIIIDEEHETSYKSETMPRYHAREVAEKLASYYGANVVLGSATPSLEAYYRAKKGDIKLYELNERLTGGMLPKVYVEDLREELKKGNRSIFSVHLQELIADRLKTGQQIMLFLNRRGYAGFISCRACGHVMKCPHCDVSLSEHKNGKLICHYCGYEQQNVKICPSCGSKYISGFKAGTQQIEDLLYKCFPGVKVLRMDADTTRNKDSYEEILSAFSNGQADVLVGTQMIVKGHDFPNVTLVGVLAADLSLSANDYRASERTFQLLTQAAGRAGRGILPGEVVIQTYQPEHYSILCAKDQDYKTFYEEEIIYRKMLHYPPAAGMLAVMISGIKEEAVIDLSKKLADKVIQRNANCENSKQKVILIGPTIATIGKINDIFRYLIYIKHMEYGILVQVKDDLENFTETLVLKNEMVQFDFNPMNTY